MNPEPLETDSLLAASKTSGHQQANPGGLSPAPRLSPHPHVFCALPQPRVFIGTPHSHSYLEPFPLGPMRQQKSRRCIWEAVFFLFFFKIFFFYLLEREAETQAEGEAGSMQGARCGTRSGVSRITPRAEGGTKPLGHPGVPEAVLKTWFLTTKGL